MALDPFFKLVHFQMFLVLPEKFDSPLVRDSKIREIIACGIGNLENVFL